MPPSRISISGFSNMNNCRRLGLVAVAVKQREYFRKQGGDSSGADTFLNDPQVFIKYIFFESLLTGNFSDNSCILKFF